MSPYQPSFLFGEKPNLQAASYGEISLLLCDHLEVWDREGGREMQEGEDMGIYVYV